MSEKKFDYKINENFVLIGSMADELYYSDLKNGSRKYILLYLGWYEYADLPGIKSFTLILPFCSLALGYISNSESK